MDIEPQHQEWLEIWSCYPSVDTGERWFVDHCTRNSKATVADCASALDADDAAAKWGLPMIYIQAGKRAHRQEHPGANLPPSP